MKCNQSFKFIVSLLLIGISIQCSTEKTELPFFNSADWEPEWIDANDDKYNSIHKISEFDFVDQNNQKITNDNYDGRIYVADFFFTTCPGICPEMTKNMQLLQEEFKEDKAIKLISHSVTPWIDTVKQLKKYAREYEVDSKKWHLVTGQKEKIYSLARNSYFIEGEMGLKLSSDDFLHTENFILVDKKRRIRGIYNGTILKDINRLIQDIYILKKS